MPVIIGQNMDQFRYYVVEPVETQVTITTTTSPFYVGVILTLADKYYRCINQYVLLIWYIKGNPSLPWTYRPVSNWWWHSISLPFLECFRLSSFGYSSCNFWSNNESNFYTGVSNILSVTHLRVLETYLNESYFVSFAFWEVVSYMCICWAYFISIEPGLHLKIHIWFYANTICPNILILKPCGCKQIKLLIRILFYVTKCKIRMVFFCQDVINKMSLPF